MKTNTLIRPSTINIKSSTLKVSVFFSPTQLILCTFSMASTPFSLPNKLFTRQFVSTPPPHCPSTLRVAATASPTASFYDVLGIHAGASRQEVKSDYRRLSRTLHPDVAPKCGGGATADAFMQVHAAYDNSPFGRRLGPADTGYSSMAPHRRSWETDQCW